MKRFGLRIRVDGERGKISTEEGSCKIKVDDVAIIPHSSLDALHAGPCTIV